ncbi:MAG: DMT family transporter [Hyphomicrobiales bacterium]|nr:DMT family transporter [Hyphomicrobiales bacterium]
MEFRGALAAILSSALGGTAIGATRYLAATLDPITIGAIRFGGGFLVLVPIVLARGEHWPKREDWLPVAGLGFLFFGIFPLLFNAALIYTTAARGALALSSLPMLTIVIGAVLRVERPTIQKTIGVSVAMFGVAVALGAGYAAAPVGAWRGDLLMMAAACCMALYSVLSRPLIARNGPLPFAAFGMGVGALFLGVLSINGSTGSALRALNAIQWVSAGYLAVVCGALIFFLWAFALRYTTATVVTVSVAVNPITAAIFGVILLGERAGPSLVLGLIAVLLGIYITQANQSRISADHAQ